MSEGFDKLAGVIGKTIETVPDLYDDALKPATQESGKTLALIPRTINAALVPLRQWIANKEYNLAETEKLLAKKLEHVGEDKIVTPEAYVAVPAIQAISYSMNSEELRNLYANLLAKAMNSDTKNYVHPSFIEIIKQMSPNDALILHEIITKDYLPYATLSVVNYQQNELGHIIDYHNNRESYVYKYITSIESISYEAVSLSIENLLRLKLVDQVFSYFSDIHQEIKNTPLYIELKNDLQQYSNETSEYAEDYYAIKLSTFGKEFCNICISDFEI